jgi:hypothetical protein
MRWEVHKAEDQNRDEVVNSHAIMKCLVKPCIFRDVHDSRCYNSVVADVKRLNLCNVPIQWLLV